MMTRVRDYWKHPARYGRVTGFYTFAFDFGADTSMLELAEKLLRAEIAETVVVPGSGEVRFAHRYKSLIKVLADAKGIVEAEEYINGEKRWSSLTWKGRWFLLKILKSALRARARNERSTERGSNDGQARGSVKAAMQEVADNTNKAVFDRQSFNALHDFVDRSLYQFDYLQTVPYVRLELKRFSAEVVASDLPEGNSWSINVRPTLLLHRSGTALLTFGIRLPESGTTASLSSMLTAVELIMSQTTISEPVMRAAAEYSKSREEDWPGTWLPEMEEGTRWRLHEHDTQAVSLVDVFNLYQDAIFRYSSKKYRHGGWVCYPTFFIEKILCCGSKGRWMRQHRSEVVALLARAQPGAPFTDEASKELLQPDFSIFSDASFWSPGGCAMEIWWNFDSEPEDMVDRYFMRLVVIENALIKFWQLRTLDDRIGRTPPKLKTIEKLLLEVAAGLTEFRKPLLGHEHANEISAHTVRRLGGPQYYESISSRLSLLQQVIAMREAVRASRRANRFAAAAVLAAALLGLPAIKQSLEIVKNVPSGGWLGSFPSFLQHPGVSLDLIAWTSYLMFISIAFILLIVRRVTVGSRNKRFVRPPVVGTSWPHGHIRVESQSRRVPKGYSEADPRIGSESSSDGVELD